MKFFSYALIVLGIFAFTLGSCKKDDPIPTPVSELILGKWRSFEKKEDGATQPSELGYSELEFSVDTLEEMNVTFMDFEEDGSLTQSGVDTWELTEGNTIIAFGGRDPYEIRKITNDSLIIYFTKNDPFSGNEVNHEDSYLKLP